MRQKYENTPVKVLNNLFRVMAFLYVITITFQSQSPIQAKNHEMKVYPEIKKINELVFDYEGITWRDRENLHSTLRNRLSKVLPEKHKSRASKISREIIVQSQKYKINPLLVMAFIQTESSFKPDAIGPVGEIGLMQLRYRTAQYVSERYDLEFKNENELKNPLINIKLGVAYLAYLKEKYEEVPAHMVPAYNVGPTKLQQKLNKNELPQAYAGKIVQNYNLFARIMKPENKSKKITKAKKSVFPKVAFTSKPSEAKKESANL